MNDFYYFDGVAVDPDWGDPPNPRAVKYWTSLIHKVQLERKQKVNRIRLGRRTPRQSHDFSESTWSRQVYDGDVGGYSPDGGVSDDIESGISRAMSPYQDEMHNMGEDSSYPDGVHPEANRSPRYSGSVYQGESHLDEDTPSVYYHDVGSPHSRGEKYQTVGYKDQEDEDGAHVREYHVRRRDGSIAKAQYKRGINGWTRLAGGSDRDVFTEEGGETRSL
jgi:hypothetical protein